MDHLFVYGTLRPQHENAYLLENIGGIWQEASVDGTVHILDWGPDQGLFAVILDGTPTGVEGYIFSSDKLQNHWQMLDDFEGFQYLRVQTRAQLQTGETIEVWIYVMNPHAKTNTSFDATEH